MTYPFASFSTCDHFKALFLLAGFEVKGVWKTENQYWREAAAPPWWVFQTEYGAVVVGWRKRVLYVGWETTNLRWQRAVDPDVTASDTMFHAYGWLKGLEYLMLLHEAFRRSSPSYGKEDRL